MEYQKLTEKDKLVMETKRQLFNKINPNKKKMIKIELEGKPKRPLNAYLLFAKSVRENDRNAKDKSVTELAKEIGENWKELSASEKKPFIDEADSQFHQYKMDMIKFQFQ